jgi:acyl-CoA synthetase (AMP-forming)/AMP-acid ligase II
VGDVSGSETLAELIRRRSVETPGRVYLEDARSDRILDYSGLERVVAIWVALFDRLRLPAGAAVLVAVRDPLSFAIVHLAAISSGRRSVPINPDLPDGEPHRTSELIGGAALVVTDAAHAGDDPIHGAANRSASARRRSR